MKKISLTLATLVVAASAFAQTQPQSQPAPATATPTAASAPGAEQRAARHEARIEQRIKYLHDQLKITSAQEPQWKTFADAMRENGETMGRLYRARIENHNVSAVDDVKQYAELAQANADGAKKLADAFAPLYESFPAEQKALADTTFRNWLHHGGEHHGKGKGKAKARSKEGKAAAAPAASAPAQP
ncbi:Spy/CpxP family protein refolding chaperone [Burkholderia anthina]|uniref:Spy/CpxP family protein refolding chaperone n=1 Tax=Burkholderia anthina TaxID=179879 RepID=UPI00158B18CB|nr:Spy/CpxP family protein refolding chaperone [Burkholderia anthina]MBY4865485.1 Spy/CpxP family protein refolding chaperone [Burkholderia anthina]